jgi:hypothetical protein
MVKARGYKLTPQRRATVDVILQNKGKHMSAEEVFLEVRNLCPEIGLATVYRTMLLLEEIQILQRHNFDDGRNRYELNHPEEDHHHHHLIFWYFLITHRTLAGHSSSYVLSVIKYICAYPSLLLLHACFDVQSHG